MDSRIYFHQYRRPRVSNPTYLSNSMQGSMTFFEKNQYSNPYSQRSEKKNSYFDSPSKPTPQQTNQYSTIQAEKAENYNRNSEVRNQNYRIRNNSNLSNYGTNSLSFNQKDVHNKQTSKFDIISLKPIEHSTQIKQYPWLTVQNKDDVYYKRMNQLYSQKQRNSISVDERSYNNNRGGDFVAGKHTYDLEKKVEYNPERKYMQNYKPQFTAKMLNHMDQLKHLS